MKKLTVIFISILLSQAAFTQSSSDVLRYSRIYYSGTARFVGTGGAFGAVGADFSALAINPAGIGLYQGSEFSMTIAPAVENIRTDYLSQMNSTNTLNVGMGNIGFVFTFKPQVRTGSFFNFNVGFGMNRQNDFNSSFTISGPNHSSSLLNVYTDKLNNTPGSKPSDYPFDIGPASDASLIYLDSNNRYTSDQPHGGAYQSKQVTTIGSINEFDITMGGNLGDKLYFGVTFGVPFIRYYENSTYSEKDNGDSIRYFSSMYYDYHLETHGTGFVIKGGVIYRPLNWMRIGVAIHSPTWYPNMHDHWFSTTSAYYDPGSGLNNNSQNSPVGDYSYYMRTPFRAIGSLAFVIGNFGLISAEYEYVNYSQARLSAPDYSFTNENNDIKSSFQSWGNIRVGTEWRIADFRIRAGAAYYSNPYTTSGIDGARYTISGGAGYRIKHFYADVTYQWAQSKEEYYLYNYTGMLPSTNTLTTSTVLTTIGFRF